MTKTLREKFRQECPYGGNVPTDQQFANLCDILESHFAPPKAAEWERLVRHVVLCARLRLAGDEQRGCFLPDALEKLDAYETAHGGEGVLTEDIGAILKAEWDTHQDWQKLGNFVATRQAASYQSGFREGRKTTAINALEALLKALKS